MPFRDFTYPKVVTDLGLKVVTAELFPGIPAVTPEPVFAEKLRDGLLLAQGSNTEKARLESLIAPVLHEVRRLLGRRYALFSGVAFDVDPDRGLSGFCDFLISRDPNQYLLSAPLVAVAEGKNAELRTGFGQCIAGMVAAAEFNRRAELPAPSVYGIVTTGIEWKLFRLTGNLLTIDANDYLIDTPGRLLGVLCHLIEHG